MILLGLVFCLSIAIQAQNTVRWTGGTPGSETNWESPKNWTPNRVPSSNDLVIIPDCSSKGGFYPELTKTAGPIAHLRVEGGARLTILSGAQLAIDGSTTFNDGITLYGTLHNEGHLSVSNAGLGDMDALPGHFISKSIAENSLQEVEERLAGH